MKKKNIKNPEHFIVTANEQIKTGIDSLKKQFMLTERDDSYLFGVLDYIQNEVYIPYLRNTERVQYKTKSIEYFINHLRYMDYIYNNSIPLLYGLTETQSLIAIAYSEMSLFEKEFDPLLSIPNKCKKSKKLFIKQCKLDTIPLTRIDRDIIITALDLADGEVIEPMHELTAPVLLARMIKDIITVGHYILGDKIDARKNIQDIVDDMNLWNDIHKKKKKITFESILARFYLKFSNKSFNTFKWSIELDDELLRKYSMFQKQIEDLHMEAE